jgi:hypothetical protein
MSSLQALDLSSNLLSGDVPNLLAPGNVISYVCATAAVVGSVALTCVAAGVRWLRCRDVRLCGNMLTGALPSSLFGVQITYVIVRCSRCAVVVAHIVPRLRMLCVCVPLPTLTRAWCASLHPQLPQRDAVRVPRVVRGGVPVPRGDRHCAGAAVSGGHVLNRQHHVVHVVRRAGRLPVPRGLHERVGHAVPSGVLLHRRHDDAVLGVQPARWQGLRRRLVVHQRHGVCRGAVQQRDDRWRVQGLQCAEWLSLWCGRYCGQRHAVHRRLELARWHEPVCGVRAGHVRQLCRQPCLQRVPGRLRVSEQRNGNQRHHMRYREVLVRWVDCVLQLRRRLCVRVDRRHCSKRHRVHKWQVLCRRLERLHRLQCWLRVPVQRLHQRDGGDVRRWQVLVERGERVHQLQRGLRMSRCIDIGDAGGGAVPCWQVQRVWCVDLQQLQRRLFVPRRLGDTDGLCLRRGEVQQRRRGDVYELQRRLHLPLCCRDDPQRHRVPERQVLPRRGVDVYGLQRWLRMPEQRVNERDGRGVCPRSVLARRVSGLRQLHRWLRLRRRLVVSNADKVLVGPVLFRRVVRVPAVLRRLLVQLRFVVADVEVVYSRQVQLCGSDDVPQLQRRLHLPDGELYVADHGRVSAGQVL